MQTTQVFVVLTVAYIVGGFRDFDEARWRRQIVGYYNILREMHDAPPLMEDALLAQKAYIWARHLSVVVNETSCLYHSRAGGENIYFRWSTEDISEEELARETIKAFYEEVKYYNYSRPGLLLPAAHFTNLVWKNCRKMGIGLYHMDYRNSHGGCNVIATPRRPAHGYMVVIHQWPNSNIMSQSQFRENVLPAKRLFTFA